GIPLALIDRAAAVCGAVKCPGEVLGRDIRHLSGSRCTGPITTPKRGFTFPMLSWSVRAGGPADQHSVQLTLHSSLIGLWAARVAPRQNGHGMTALMPPPKLSCGCHRPKTSPS